MHLPPVRATHASWAVASCLHRLACEATICDDYCVWASGLRNVLNLDRRLGRDSLTCTVIGQKSLNFRPITRTRRTSEGLGSLMHLARKRKLEFCSAKP